MRFSLIPREMKFFDFFDEITAVITRAAVKFLDMLTNFDNLAARGIDIKKCEEDCDLIIERMLKALDRTFITPIDREDIHALCSALDDVLDLIDGAAARLITYKITAVTPGALQLAKVIQHASEILVRAVAQLNKPENILEYCDQLTQLEKDGDRIKGECVAKLFENTSSPTDIIKWKEIYEVLEATTDKCEDVADVLESVVLKTA